MITAIDGPAGSGKSTTARLTAEKLGFIHLDTGAMYRGITLKFIREKVDLSDLNQVRTVLNSTQLEFRGRKNDSLFLDGEDVSREIRMNPVTENVSEVSAIPDVRQKLVQWQREMSRGINVVLEGRDIGTRVFPDAEFKFFLIADIKIRAQRRLKELKAKGEKCTLEEIISLLEKRDEMDSTRTHSPLRKAEDAIEIDTSKLNIEEQVNCIVKMINHNNQKE